MWIACRLIEECVSRSVIKKSVSLNRCGSVSRIIQSLKNRKFSFKSGFRVASPANVARAKAILQSEFPYTISARCINKEWFNVPLEKVWQIFCDNLTLTHETHGLQIHSFVMMSNHFHLLASTPNANISQCMLHFMTRSSKALTKAGNRINETFAGRHYKCVLSEYNYFLNAYKYNYRNPVAAGLCERVEDYAYSTLPMKLGLLEKKIPLNEDTLLNEDREGILKWLNTAPDPELLEAARTAFKRPFFKSKNKRDSGQPILGPKDLI